MTGMADPTHGPALRLTKHHGAGNDFLVLLDPDDRRPLSGAERPAPCATAAGGSGPTACCGPRCGAPRRRSPWTCATPTAGRPR